MQMLAAHILHTHCHLFNEEKSVKILPPSSKSAGTASISSNGEENKWHRDSIELRGKHNKVLPKKHPE